MNILDLLPSETPLTIGSTKFVAVDMYGGFFPSTVAATEAEAIQKCIDHYNADIDKILKTPLAAMAAKKLSTWDDLDKIGISIAEISHTYVKGYKAQPQPATHTDDIGAH